MFNNICIISILNEHYINFTKSDVTGLNIIINALKNKNNTSLLKRRIY